MATELPKHWKASTWEEKARENPLFAVQSMPGMADAPPEGFTPELLEAFFKKGRLIFDQHIEPLLPQSPDPKGKTLVVEYGCGAGRLLKPLIDRGYRCSGIDISSTMLRHCRDLTPEVEALSELDAEGRCAIASESASIVFSHAVVQHISRLSHYVTAIDEMCRILKPGGVLALHLNCEDFADGPDGPFGRTENHETYSLHYRPGATEPYLRHDQNNWSGVYIGRDTLASILAGHGVTMERWRPHTASKPRSVWAIGRKSPA